MEKIWQTGEKLETQNETRVSLIHKEGLDYKEVKNYRPISFLNSDYKLFVIILANRLEKMLMEIIHPDQAGFLPHRYISNTVQAILNILQYYEAHQGKPIY